MKTFNWGEETSVAELGKFVTVFTDYRLTFIIPAVRDYRGTTYTGSTYKLEFQENGHLLTSECKKKTLFVVWNGDHFGIAQAPTTPYGRFTSTVPCFCHKCITCYRSEQGCNCERNAKKAKTLNEVSKCSSCKMTPCMKSGCSRNCNYCGTRFQYGYNRNNGEGHRCIVYYKDKHEKFLTTQGENFETRNKEQPYKLWVYDIEATTTVTEKTTTAFLTEDNSFVVVDGEYQLFERKLELQKTNLVVFRDVFDPHSEQIFFGEDSLKNFITFMLANNNGKNICIAHNGSGYDTRLVLEELGKFSKNVKTKTTSNGTKIMELRAENIIFRDSLLHLQGSLSGLAKSFDLPIQKGTFPHLFNTPSNYTYNGQIPSKKYFDLTFTARSQKDLDNFNDWYEERSKTPWNFMEELKSYCRDDVKILAELVRKHHDICFEDFKISPWFSSTAPAYVHKIIRSLNSNDETLKIPDSPEDRTKRINELAWNEHWGVLIPQEYWHARKALIGGRTDTRRTLFELSEDDIRNNRSIAYVDVVSMYPYCQIRKGLEYPVGLPRIKIYDDKFYPCTKHQAPETGNYLEQCGCSRREKFADRLCDVEEIFEQPSREYMQDYNTFGIATVSMTPPKNLFHPVLQVMDPLSGKRISSLDPIIEQTFTMLEIQRALSKGYEIDKVHRIDLYNKAPALWTDFIGKLYIEKMVNSGPAPSLEEQQRLVEEYEAGFGLGEAVRQSFPRWAKRPAKRHIYKIMLNSGWGKHCQRPNMSENSFIHEDDSVEMMNLFSNITHQDVQLVDLKTQGNKTVFKTKANSKNPLSHDSYIPAGLFVPAFGRLMLFEQLDQLGDRVLYHDTDSIIYIKDPTKYNIPTGDILGDWDEEEVSKNENITGFVSIGAKSYALKTKNGNDVVKLKGLMVRKAHDVSYETLKELVLNENCIELPQRNFKYKMGEGISIVESFKKVEFRAANFKGDLRNGVIYPFGYEEI